MKERYDLKFQNDDIAIENGDFALASGIDVLIQDIYNQVRVAHYSWALSFLFGSRITEYINMPDEPLKLVELKKDIISIFRRDERIVKDSWEIKISNSKIGASFLLVGRKGPITLVLKEF